MMQTEVKFCRKVASQHKNDYVPKNDYTTEMIYPKKSYVPKMAKVPKMIMAEGNDKNYVKPCMNFNMI